MTRFEQAYVNLYTDRITLDEFPQAAGIADKQEALDRLRAYRLEVLEGRITDPRGKEFAE